MEDLSQGCVVRLEADRWGLVTCALDPVSSFSAFGVVELVELHSRLRSSSSSSSAWTKSSWLRYYWKPCVVIITDLYVNCVNSDNQSDFHLLVVFQSLHMKVGKSKRARARESLIKRRNEEILRNSTLELINHSVVPSKINKHNWWKSIRSLLHRRWCWAIGHSYDDWPGLSGSSSSSQEKNHSEKKNSCRNRCGNSSVSIVLFLIYLCCNTGATDGHYNPVKVHCDYKIA